RSMQFRPSLWQAYRQCDLSRRVCVVTNQQWDVQGLACLNADFRMGKEVGKVLDIVSLPELPVERPRSTQFHRHLRARLWLITSNRCEGNPPAANPLERVSRYRAAHQRLTKHEPHRLLEVVEFSCSQGVFGHLAAIALREMKAHFFGSELVVGFVSCGGNSGRIKCRPTPLQKICVRGIREIVDLLRLPGTQALR